MSDPAPSRDESRLYLCFQKNWPSLFARVVRMWTWSPHNHVELRISDAAGYQHFNADVKLGTVTFKSTELHPHFWDIVPVPGLSAAQVEQVRAWLTDELGCPYDWAGILLTQFLPLGRQSRTKWFCSELCVAALQQVGLLTDRKPWRVSPAKLWKLTKGWR